MKQNFNKAVISVVFILCAFQQTYAQSAQKDTFPTQRELDILWDYEYKKLNDENIIYSEKELIKIKRIDAQITKKIDSELILGAQKASLGDEVRFSKEVYDCLLYTSPSPRDRTRSRMPSSA